MGGLAQQLYNVNPSKFNEVAKDKTYAEFIKYLEQQPNFQVINIMRENEKQELYLLALGGK